MKIWKKITLSSLLVITPLTNVSLQAQVQSKHKIVSVGDSYSSALSAYGNDKGDSFGNFLSQDLKSTNSIDWFDKSFAQTGETLDQTAEKLGISKNSLLSQNLISGSHKLSTLEKSTDYKKKLEEKIKQADTIFLTAGGNDLLSIFKIMGIRVTDIENIQKKLKTSTADDAKKAIKDLLVSSSRDKNNQFQNSNDKEKQVISKLSSFLKDKDFNHFLTLGENSKSVDQKLLSNPHILEALKNDPKMNNVYQSIIYLKHDLEVVEKRIKEINPNIKIIHVGYANPFIKLPMIGETFNKLISELLIKPLKEVTINNNNTYVQINDKLGFSNATSEEQLYKNLPNALDIHPSLSGHQQITQIIENQLKDYFKVNSAKINRDQQLSEFQNKPINHVSTETKTKVDGNSKKVKDFLAAYEKSNKDLSIFSSNLGLVNPNDKSSRNVIHFIDNLVTKLNVDTSILKSYSSKMQVIFYNLLDSLNNYKTTNPDNKLTGKDAFIYDMKKMKLNLFDNVKMKQLLSHLNLAGTGSVLSKIPLSELVAGLSDPEMQNIGTTAFLDKYEATDPKDITTAQHLVYFLSSVFFSDGKNGRTSIEQCAQEMKDYYTKYKDSFSHGNIGNQISESIVKGQSHDDLIAIYSQVVQGILMELGGYQKSFTDITVPKFVVKFLDGTIEVPNSQIQGYGRHLNNKIIAPKGYLLKGQIKESTINGVITYIQKVGKIIPQTKQTVEKVLPQTKPKEEVKKHGWQKVNNVWFHYSTSGNKQTGWQKVSNHWYYLSKSGAMTTGWQKVNNHWYYLSKSGAMTTGWQKVNNHWYYLSKSGAMTTGWQKISKRWYWFNKSGSLYTKKGWERYHGHWMFSFGENGYATNEKVSKYWLNNSGYYK